MTNRQVQRDAQRDRRRQERQQARRELRQSRPVVTQPVAKVADAPPRRGMPWAWIAVCAVAGLLIAGGIFYIIRENTQPLPGKVYPSQGNQHINPGDSHPAYNSNPPTSGWHYPTWPQRGIYTSPLPEEYLIHFQEHAGVVVHYNPSKLPQDQYNQLKAIVNSELGKGQGLVVLAPDPNIDAPIALTSWQHLETLDKVTGNKSKIQDFIERLECNYDPEGVCGPPHGNQFYPTGTPGPGVATVVSQPISPSIPTATPAPGQQVEKQTPVSSAPTP